MKRLIAGIITIILTLACAFGLTACGEGKETTSMKNWGAIQEVGGAVAETENYLYYINGIGENTASNDWGKPIKGSLMVVDKSTIGTDELKTEIVVPKLFIATDYKAGLHLSGEGEETYVYYATPSVEKDASGKVASTSLTFTRTRLDGKKTEEFFTVKGLDTDYRIAEKDGVVYFVYYDENTKILKSYNTSDKTEVEIAKIDEKTTEQVTLPGGAKVYMTLSGYRLLPNGSSAQAVFTMTVYAENYFPEKAEDVGEEYVRAQESFNVMYSYTVGDEKDEYGVYGKMIKNGEEKDLTFDMVLAEDGYFFYTQKDIVGETLTYALSLNDLGGEETHIVNPEYLKEFVVIKDLGEIYYIDSDKAVVYSSTLIDNDTDRKETVITGDKAASLLYIHGDYMYYFAKSNKIARILLDGKSEEEIVSNDIVSSVWFDPEIKNVNGTNYMFYIDASTEGSSYVKFVNIDNDAVLCEGEDETTAGDDYYTLEGHVFLGKMSAKDEANKAISAIESIPSSALDYEINEDGELVLTAVANAKAEYDKLSDESKNFVANLNKTKLANAEKAQELARYYYALKDYKEYDKMSDEEKAEFKKAYEDAKAFRQGIINEKDSPYTTVRDFIKDEIKAYYQEASKLFEEKE